MRSISIGTIIALATLLLMYRQTHSFDRQTDSADRQAASAEKQNTASGEALFSLQTVSTDGLTGHLPTTVAATKVVLHCETEGPSVPLGTIGADKDVPVHLKLHLEPDNPVSNYEADCLSTRYLNHHDGNGAHRVQFDSAGNAIAAQN